MQRTQGERQAGIRKGVLLALPLLVGRVRERSMTGVLIMPDTFWEPRSPVEIWSACFDQGTGFCVNCHWIWFLILKLSITGPELNDAIRGIIN